MPRFAVSAQFGGRDAAEIFLPHFRALKKAAAQAELLAFPANRFAFILRGDGEISRYNLSGAGRVDVAGDGDYISVDIGVTVQDRSDLVGTIARAVLAAPPLVRDRIPGQLDSTGLAQVQAATNSFVKIYRKALEDPDQPNRPNLETP